MLDLVALVVGAAPGPGAPRGSRRPHAIASAWIPCRTEIDREGVQRLLAGGALLVEVLPSSEYDEDHLPGAVNVPLRQIDRQAGARLDRSRPVIVYCWDIA